MGCIYKYTCNETQMSYIGVTGGTIDLRIRQHIQNALRGPGGCRLLARAIKKYGPEAFTVKVLVIANDPDYLDDLEIKAIAAFNTLTPNGYNLTTGGIRPKWSQESRNKLGVTVKARFQRMKENGERLWPPLTNETRAKLSKAMKDRIRLPITEITRKRMSISATQKFQRMADEIKRLDFNQILNIRFWPYVDKSRGEDNCWPWTGPVDDNGFGYLQGKKLSGKAHRISYEVSGKQIPDGHIVTHICQMKLCVNYNHLTTKLRTSSKKVYLKDVV